MKRLFTAFRLLIAVAVTFSITFFVTAYVLNAAGLRTFDPTTDLTAVVVVTSATPSSVATQVLKTDTLPMGTEESLRFYGNNKSHPDYLLNAKGLWVFGKTIVLTQPDGAVHRLDFFDDTVAPGESSRLHVVGLDDDSVLAVLVQRKRRDDRFYQSVQFFRVTLQGGKSGLGLRHLVLAPKLDNDIGRDIAAIKLADGQVLVTGVHSGGTGSVREMQFWLYNPRNDVWQATGSLNHTRADMAFGALLDGRAFVAGGRSDGSVAGGHGDANFVAGDRGHANRSAELWDPRTGRWEMLPPMPLSFKIDAHNATAPSAAVLPDGSLVVGGGMHRHVVLLRAKEKSFAPYWTIAGSTPSHRISGIVQALGNNEVVVLGGVAPLREGGCCRRQTGGDRIVWHDDGTGRDPSLSLGRKDAAVAHRGDITFAAGGWETFEFSSPATQVSAVAELIDRRSGRVQDLPSLPHPLHTGRAMWLDDDRVLVKGVTHKRTDLQFFSEHIFRLVSGSALEEDSSGFLAIYSRRKNNWKTFEDSRVDRADLAGVARNEAVLIGSDTKVWAVTLDASSVRELPRMIQARADGVSRIINDQRVVVAGGRAQAGLIQASDADCRRPDCPLRYFGTGSLEPSRRHEILDLGSHEWQLSAPSHAAGESAIIRRDGRVVKLGLASSRWLIEESDVSGIAWRNLPWPTGLSDVESRDDDSSCGRSHERRQCVLMIGERPDASDAVFLLRARWDNKLPGQRYDLWVSVDNPAQWISIAKDLTEEKLFARQTLPQQVDGKTVYASFFLPNKVRIWVE